MTLNEQSDILATKQRLADIWGTRSRDKAMVDGTEYHTIVDYIKARIDWCTASEYHDHRFTRY